MYLFVVYCILIVLGFFCKESKLVTILIFLFAWILIGWNYDGPDFENNLWRFETANTWANAISAMNTDYGYSFLCYIGNSLGLSFMAFKRLLAGVSYILIISFVFKVGKSPALIASCYLASISLIDVIQIRNFFAMSCILFGFRYLLKPNSSAIDSFKYSIWVILAASIHISLAFGLLFLFAKRPIKTWSLVSLLILSLVLKTYVFDYFTTSLETERYENYRGVSSLSGGLLNTIIFCANAFFLLWISNKGKKGNNQLMGLFPDATTMINVNLLLLVLIPFLFESGNFTRLLKDILIANYAFLAIHFHGKKRTLLLVGYALVFMFYYIIFDASRTTIFQSVFSCNSFFKL